MFCSGMPEASELQEEVFGGISGTGVVTSKENSRFGNWMSLQSRYYLTYLCTPYDSGFGCMKSIEIPYVGWEMDDDYLVPMRISVRMGKTDKRQDLC